MKFKLPRQVLSTELRRVISREMRKQKMLFPKISRKELKQLAEMSKTIQTRGLPEFLVCKKLGQDLGYGIFLHPDAKPIEKGRLIGSYAGELSLICQNEPDDGSYAFTPVENIVLKKEEQILFDKKHVYRPKRLYSLKVDGLKKGNFTRFINHSETPNLIAYTLAVPSNPYSLASSPVEIIYFAKKVINPGEQLLVSYEDGEKCYWGTNGKKPFPMTPKTFRITNKNRLRVSTAPA